MELKDAINAAKNISLSTKYSTTVYRDKSGKWCFMETGVAENCWPDDIYEMVGIWLYEKEKFLESKNLNNWSSDELFAVTGMLNPKNAKRKYESMSTVGSRFDWPI